MMLDNCKPGMGLASSVTSHELTNVICIIYLHHGSIHNAEYTLCHFCNTTSDLTWAICLLHADTTVALSSS